MIVGGGPLKESYKLQVTSYKLQDQVIFAGSVGYDDLPIYLKISDVFVRPSRSEGLGSAFLEAMAAGVPIIGTKVGGIPDFLEDRRTGLFTKLDPEDIASKIFILFENTALRHDIIRNGSNLVREKYNWDKIAIQFKELYRELG